MAEIFSSDSLPPMKEESVGARIIRAREAKGWSTYRLAKEVGLAISSVQELESGETQTTRHIVKYAEKLGQDVNWLATGRGEFRSQLDSEYEVNISQPVKNPVPNPATLPRDVPVLGTAIGGSNGDFSFSGQVIDYVRRAPGIMTKRAVYCLNVRGDSMSPWREENDLIFVDPNVSPKAGDYAVIEMKPAAPGEPGHAFVKLLVAKTPTKIKCRQFNPKQELEFKLDQIARLHRVLTQSELLGI